MLFDKIAFFTDIHFGRGANSPVLLKDDVDFVKWFIDEAKTRGCKTCVFGGDWHDVRHTVQVATMLASLDCMQLLNDAFEKVWWLPGNHDLYFRDSREVSSIEFARNIPNIHVVRQPFTQDGVTFLPWLIGDEHKRLASMTDKSRYVFAHLEVPGFLMNAKSAMPDKDDASQAESFTGVGTVFTGHFHMRQQKGNILYTGNTMPHDFNDDWDSDRGAMFLSWGKDPEFVAWPDQPLFRSMTLSELLEKPDRLLKNKVTAKVTRDIEISFEESQLIKDTFVTQYGLRKFEFAPNPKAEAIQEFNGDVVFQSVDQIVIDGLRSVQSNGVSAETLVEVYRSLG